MEVGGIENTRVSGVIIIFFSAKSIFSHNRERTEKERGKEFSSGMEYGTHY